MEIKEQVRLLRGVIGRKIMEIDEFDNKAAEATGDESEKFMNMIDFLEKDIAGYKSIVDDLKDGTNDLTGNLWDIASLPQDALELYTQFYVPSLSEYDQEDERTAMEIKSKYAIDLANAYVLDIGRLALSDPKVLDLMMANEAFATMIGTAVLETPELRDAMGIQ